MSFESIESIYSDAGYENSQSQLSQQQHHHSQTNANSALMLMRFLNCLGKAAVGIVYYVDCTVKDELLRRKEAKQSSETNKKSQSKPRKSTKKRKTPDEDDENPSTSMNDTTTNSSNLTVIRKETFSMLNYSSNDLVEFHNQSINR